VAIFHHSREQVDVRKGSLRAARLPHRAAFDCTSRSPPFFCLILSGHTLAQVGPNGEVDGLTAKFGDVNGVRTHYYYDEG
jgi:hypothetical protein